MFSFFEGQKPFISDEAIDSLHLYYNSILIYKNFKNPQWNHGLTPVGLHNDAKPRNPELGEALDQLLEGCYDTAKVTIRTIAQQSPYYIEGFVLGRQKSKLSDERQAIYNQAINRLRDLYKEAGFTEQDRLVYKNKLT